jgi:hypothetical protein
VRSAGDAAALATTVRAAARELDPSLSVFNVRTLDFSSGPACSSA